MPLAVWGQVLVPPSSEFEAAPAPETPTTPDADGGVDEVDIDVEFPSELMTDIVIRGLRRTSLATALQYLTFEIGDPFDKEQLDESVRRLYASGLFRSIRMVQEGSELVILVEENAILNQIAYENNKILDDESLRIGSSLRSGVIFSRSRVQSEVQRLLLLYQRRGHFGAKIVPKLIELPENRLNLVFEIEEAEVTRILKIDFIGNQTFGHELLSNVILSREKKFYRLLDSVENWDPDKVEVDRSFLEDFYQGEGFLEVRVEWYLSELATDKSGFLLTFAIEEGPRFRLEAYELQNELETLSVEPYRRFVEKRSQQDRLDWVSLDSIRDIENELAVKLSREGYRFFRIEKIEKLHPEDDPAEEQLDGPRTPRITLTFKIRPAPPVYVERIEIAGNTLTADNVIRRRLLLTEGDPMNQTFLNQSIVSLQRSGFFERVTHSLEPGSEEDLVRLRIEVVERSTGSANIGLGYSDVSGGTLLLAYGERNFLGRGLSLQFETNIAQYTENYSLRFFNPSWNDTHVGYSFGASYTRRALRQLAYDFNSSAGYVGMSYRMTRHWRQSIRLTTRYDVVENIESDASPYIFLREGGRTVRTIRLGWVYDTRNNSLFPTDGTLFSVFTTKAGWGGDPDYGSVTTRLDYHFGVTEQTDASVGWRAGSIMKFEEDLTVSDRFLLGSQTLRGFRYAGVGPRDLTHDDALGGTRYWVASSQYNFPLGLPEEVGLKGFLYANAGLLEDIAEAPLPDSVIVDSPKVRSSVGYGFLWRTAIGPIRFEFSRPQRYESFDRRQHFRLSFGTSF